MTGDHSHSPTPGPGHGSSHGHGPSHGCGHAHDHGGWWNFPLNRVGRPMAGFVVVAILATVIGMALLWPDGDTATDSPFLSDAERVDGVVESVSSGACTLSANPETQCLVVTFSITSGPTRGDDWSTEYSEANNFIPDFVEGQAVVLASQPGTDPRFAYYFVDYQRSTPMWALTALFAVAIIALGRMVGVRSLVSLALSLLILTVFMLPSILDGNNPVAVALIGSAAVALVALYLTHGFNHLTTVALLGCFASLIVTGLLARLFIGLSSITGLTDENAALLTFGSSPLSLRGLLLAGVVIGTVGVLDDVTITQASAVSEVHNASPTAGFTELYSAGLRIGRAHIASVVNTLVLAYAGASLPLLLLFTQTQQSLGATLNSEIVAVEIVRTLVGSIGLVAAIPLTTALAAVVVGFNDQRDAG